MALPGYFCLFLVASAFMVVAVDTSDTSRLTANYYDETCPDALSVIQSVVQTAVQRDFPIGSALLRLQFLDCFDSGGCDGSILLVSDSQKNANSIQHARGFKTVDRIKEAVNQVCGESVVSCADILALAARDSVVALGGPTWEVKLGRRDSTVIEAAAANPIPSPFSNLSQLIADFKSRGLNERDLVVLSGAHSIGYARCATFKDHIYNESNIDPNFADELKSICPRNGNDFNLVALDPTPAKFDTSYFYNLVQKKGLLHSDQQLFSGGSTDSLVQQYSYDSAAFFEDFALSMLKMGDIEPITRDHGEIRVDCKKVN